jgi:HSP90 family molecular chaperone
LNFLLITFLKEKAIKHYNVLKVLKAVEIEFLKTPHRGICILVLDELDCNFTLLEANKIYESVQKAIKKWPKYSRSTTYPIELDKTSKHKESPSFCFNKISKVNAEKPPYYMEYIALRKELLEFLIEHFTEGKSNETLPNT